MKQAVNGTLSLSYDKSGSCGTHFRIAPDGTIKGNLDKLRNPQQLYNDALDILNDPAFRDFLKHRDPSPMTDEAIDAQFKALKEGIKRKSPSSVPGNNHHCLIS